MVALTRRWTHRAYHLADGGQLPTTAGELQKAQSLLDEVRALLADAADSSEQEAASNSGVSVQRV
jgi:hypothetical protein